MSDKCRQHYEIATGGGQTKNPTGTTGAKPGYAKGGMVKSNSGVHHSGGPKGFKPTPKSGC